MGMPSHQKSQLWKEFSSAGSLVAGGETVTFPGALIQNSGSVSSSGSRLSIRLLIWFTSWLIRIPCNSHDDRWRID